jgi:transcriptional pleiotropic regulator of transition state genes
MKAIGIVRKVDELGRIVIPMELRRTFGIEKEDPLEIFVDDDMIILKKYEPACIFCGSAEEIIKVGNKNVCRQCIKDMQKL